MTLQELGGLGEFISALAVIASLVYVAREIRHNTNASRLSTLHASLNSAQSIFDAPSRDGELARIVRVGMIDPSRLTEDEDARLVWWVTLVLRTAENTFLQHQAGLLDDKSWAARANAIRGFIAAPAAREIWKAQPSNYHEDFRSWISPLLTQEPISTWPHPRRISVDEASKTPAA